MNHNNDELIMVQNSGLFLQALFYFCIHPEFPGIKKHSKMNISHIEHIGIAVENLGEAVPFFEKLLGQACYAIEEVTEQKVKTAFFRIGQTKIELLESTDPEGPVGRFIGKRGPGVHHLAFAVDDVNHSLAEAEEKGIRLIDKQSRKGAEGLDIGFLHPASTNGVLIEFCSGHDQQ